MPARAIVGMYGWLRDIGDFFFPRCCMVCGRVLLHDEDFLCSHCLVGLPRTDYCRMPDNPMEQLFYGKLPVVHCAAYFFFADGGDGRRLIHRIKYDGAKECGAYLGNLFARENAVTGFFSGIEYIVPVPLHPRKLRRRGYNQSEWIAQGIADATGIPLCTDLLECVTDKQSQTRKGIYDRWLSTYEAFEAHDGIVSSDAHILLVDDVVTTGATLLACGEALRRVDINRLSICALSLAK